MWPFESAEKRKIKKIIKEISEFTIKDLENKGLVSLYVTGSFLTKSRIISSNVGLIGIVGSQFRVDFEEARMNKILAEKKDTLCQGFNVLFKALSPDRAASELLKDMATLKRLWGQSFDFEKKLKNKAKDLKKRAHSLINLIENEIKQLRKGTFKFQIQDFPKDVIELSTIESDRESDFKYDPSHIKFTQEMQQRKRNIIKEAVRLRDPHATPNEIIEFTDDVDLYLKDVKHRMKDW